MRGLELTDGDNAKKGSPGDNPLSPELLWVRKFTVWLLENQIKNKSGISCMNYKAVIQMFPVTIGSDGIFLPRQPSPLCGQQARYNLSATGDTWPIINS